MRHRSTGPNPFRFWPRAALVAVAVLALSGIGLNAQLPAPPSKAWQFDITGVLQSATADSLTDNFAGGTLKVNGHTIIVPRNTIVIMPASAYTWTELFTKAPAPYTGTFTGLALADTPTPMTTYEFHVVGNALNGTYIAGLIDIAQNGLMQGQGYINDIDLGTGDIYVGTFGASRAASSRLQINDPVGRFGRAVISPDERFQVDSDSPTIASSTGYPMCVPRSAAADAECPQTNRPADPAQVAGFSTNFMMGQPGAGVLNPLKQAPLEIGDYVTYSGILVNTGATPTAGPVTPGMLTYISAFSIDDNAAIYTQPGVNPAYVTIEVALIGTGGVTIPGAGEAADRMRVEGFTTDPSRFIHLYALDYQADGSAVQRDWGRIGVDPGVAGAGAVMGRWRYRPPCTNTLPDVTHCTPPAAGVYVPAPRELRAVLEGAFPDAALGLVANGLTSGQYHAPIDEYIFPENIPGAVIPPSNFETLQFLAFGGYSSVTGAVAPGQLFPWPGDVAPPGRTQGPLVSITATPNPVISGGTVALSGAGSSGLGTLSFAWTASAGTIVSANTVTTNFIAPVVAVATPVTITLTVTDGNNVPSVGTLIVNVNPPDAPVLTVSAPLNRTLTTGGSTTFTATCTPAPCTITWSQLNPGVLDMPVISPNPTIGGSLTVHPTLGLGVSAKVMQLQAIATSGVTGVASAPVSMTVTVNPVPDTVALTSVEYRVGKQRLLLTATSSVISPKVVLTLDPYISTSGALVTPGAVGILLNNGGGLYTLDLVGFPQPANTVTVRSSLGGSDTQPLTRIRP